MAWIAIVNKYSNTDNGIIVEKASFKNKYDFQKLIIYENFDARFSNDKCICKTDTTLALIDGVTLNTSELFEDSNSSDFSGWLLKQKYDANNLICKYLRGPFNGIYYSSTENEFYAFGNQTGDTSVFYYEKDNLIIVSNEFNYLFNICKENNISLTVNETSINHILSLGFIVEGHTIANEIKRVKPGELIHFKDGSLQTKTYHKFSNSKILDISIEEAINLIDYHFRKAVTRCLKKDIEYNYRNHLIDISGGFDSRMTTWVSHDLGFSNITNICYSKSFTDEYKFAKLVTNTLNNDFIFKELDDLNFFYDIDEIVKKNYGLAIYNGITGGNRLLKSLNFNLFGLEHTGQLGDVIIGTFCANPEDNVIDPARICHSDLIKPMLSECYNYENFELFALYYRGFQSALTTHFIRRNYTEITSPFIDVDFIELCLSIPLQYRCNHLLYWEWLLRKYPNAAKLPSQHRERDKVKINFRSLIVKILGKRKREIIQLMQMLGIERFIQSKNSMNPIDYWYFSNNKLKLFVEDYYNSNIKLVNQFPIIETDIKKLFHGERANDKFLAITALGIFKNYFQ